jgi:hypothetical protein
LDTRTHGARTLDPHPVYRIPLDKRLYTPPEYKEPERRLSKKKHSFRSDLKIHTVVTQLGYKLWRVRGLKQPGWISMMMNKRIRAHQRRIDKFHQLEEQLEMVRMEQHMLSMLDPKLAKEEKGFGKFIIYYNLYFVLLFIICLFLQKREYFRN